MGDVILNYLLHVLQAKCWNMERDKKEFVHCIGGLFRGLITWVENNGTELCSSLWTYVKVAVGEGNSF
jgi:hypothetical protein